ncbi:MAG: LPS export ABC transporter permease LptG [Sphingomonas sp. SCN 67-18]|uniref:LPS export ABC transporter permease LptG n=1 Tax=uncultured Sphingomonas sp. TaxID=158754 RepID=UPI00086AE8B8|nr:LPS export ABC transporter permease LptG [Sphingomonas sp. SCN 67-18]ODU20037.1 MAG: LPS export ABC transporter permease LptG [Sphingomonas sp. SCN 67-18]
MQMKFFPSRTVAFYMARLFLVRTLAVLAALVIILQALDLLGESGKILAYPGNGDAQLWTYVSLRMPQIVARFLPFSVLLATLITLSTLNQNSEIVSLKASGMSAHQVLAPLITASLLVVIVSFAFNDRIVARATATLDQWQRVDYGPLPSDKGVLNNIWVRDGSRLVHIGQTFGRGTATQVRAVTIYDRASGALDWIITAPRGTFTGTAWRLEEALRFDVAKGTNTPLGTIDVGRGITPDQVTLANVDGDGLSFLGLAAAIEDLKVAGRPTLALEANLWHKLAGPLSALLMPLLGAVAGFGLARSGQLFIRLIVGMGLGFTYFVADNFALAMGNLGAYPPMLAAWAPFLLFLLIGETVLVRTEE